MLKAVVSVLIILLFVVMIPVPSVQKFDPDNRDAVLSSMIMEEEIHVVRNIDHPIFVIEVPTVPFPQPHCLQPQVESIEFLKPPSIARS